MKFFNTIPEEVELEPLAFLRWLKGPAIFKVGSGEECVIFMTLLHGIEPSGTYAFLEQLRRLKKNDDLKQTVYFVFASVRAALKGNGFEKRYCDDESDMNRIWSTPGEHVGQNAVVEELKQFIKSTNPKLLVDFHNTTGHNPLFGIVTTEDRNTLELVSYLTDFVLYYPGKKTAIGWAADFCPSIVIECGKNDAKESHEDAAVVLERALILCGARKGEIERRKTVRLADSIKQIHIDDDATIGISDTNTGEDLVIRSDIDHMNTTLLESGTVLGWVNKEHVISHDYLAVEDGKVILKKSSTFIMFSKIIDVIKKDCLGYSVDERIVVLDSA